MLTSYTPEIRDLVQRYHDRWNQNFAAFVPPKRWIARTDGEDKLQAALGWTAQEGLIFIGALVCQPTKSGHQEMYTLATEFADTIRDSAQVVMAATVYDNKRSQRLCEALGLKPLSISYAYVRKNHG